MTKSKIITDSIMKMPQGKVITYSDFSQYNSPTSVAMVLSSLYKKGIIKKLAKGKYYKPVASRFGELPLTENEIVLSFIKDQGYTSGTDAFNQLGFTTQVPNQITIVTNRAPRKIKIGYLNIKFEKINPLFNKEDCYLLQILDAIKMIKQIPDSTANKNYQLVKNKVIKFSAKEIETLVNLALKYKPSVRAVIGAIIEPINKKLALKLKTSLNPVTKYKLGLKDSQLMSWGIK